MAILELRVERVLQRLNIVNIKRYLSYISAFLPRRPKVSECFQNAQCLTRSRSLFSMLQAEFLPKIETGRPETSFCSNQGKSAQTEIVELDVLQHKSLLNLQARSGPWVFPVS